MALGGGRSSRALPAAWRRGAGGRAVAAEPPKNPQPGAPAPEDFKLPAGGRMPTRALGRTGVEVSLLGLGGFHIGLAKDEATAARIVRTAIDHGVTFLDNCWDYNDGRSQVWMGRALRDGYRQARVPDDQDRRAHAASRRRPDRSVPARVRDRRDRPGADPRGDPPVGSRSRLRPERRDRGARGGAQGGQDPLRRLHRSQEPG